MNGQKRKKFWGSVPKYKLPKSNDEPSTSNRFHLLSDDDEEQEKKERIPPIIVDSSVSFSNVLAKLGEDFIFKRMSIGTKVTSSTITQYNEALESLKKSNFNFYTHEVKSSKIFKLVLFGLPRLPIDSIMNEFITVHNIKPVSVKEINTKRSCEDDALYIVEFDRNHVSKNEVLKIKHFGCVVVHWRRPFKGNKGPTQCAKCAMYGHGARNCNRVKVCTACAGNHDSGDCSLSKSGTHNSVVYKCFNCCKRNFKNINHRADDPNCPCRREYLEIRQRLTARTRAIVTRSANPDINDCDFPQLPRQNRGENARDGNTSSQGRVLFSDVSRGNSRDNNDDDLTNEKLLEIFFNAVDALEKCRTKFDKLRVLGMMLKHAI